MAEKRRKKDKRLYRIMPESQQNMAKQPVPPKLKLLITIVNREKTDIYLELLRLYDINIQLATAARGTASAEMLRYLGLTDSDKSVIFSVVREDKADDALRFFAEQFKTIKKGKGISFTVPVSSIIGVSAYRFLSNTVGTNMI